MEEAYNDKNNIRKATTERVVYRTLTEGKTFGGSFL